MTIKPFIKAIAAMAVSGMMLNASANSIGLDAMEYDGATGSITVAVNYDFTTTPMFGGGLNLLWDASVLEFGNYEQAPLASDAQAPASPIGGLATPGAYEGFGIGTFEFFNGMTSAGTIGTFTFSVIGPGPGDGGCGMTLCLEENATNPFVTLAGGQNGAAMLDAGNSGANLAPIPVPAAVWFMLSGLGALLGFGRKSA